MGNLLPATPAWSRSASPWSEADWERALETLGHQALYGAHLGSELPPDLESALGQAGVSLLPAPQEAIVQICPAAAKSTPPASTFSPSTGRWASFWPTTPGCSCACAARTSSKRCTPCAYTASARAISKTTLRPLTTSRARNRKQVNGRGTRAARKQRAARHRIRPPFWGSASAHKRYRPFIVPAVELACCAGSGTSGLHARKHRRLRNVGRNLPPGEPRRWPYAADPVSKRPIRKSLRPEANLTHSQARWRTPSHATLNHT